MAKTSNIVPEDVPEVHGDPKLASTDNAHGACHVHEIFEIFHRLA